MSDVMIDADAFGKTIEQMLGRVGEGVKSLMPEAVDKALDVGEKAWKRNARSVLSSSYSRGGWGKKKKTYTKSGRPSKKIAWYGKTIKTGKYARSIRHRMITAGGDTPDGEIGSPSLPGLAHLLEKGHAMIGGGRVPAHVHIEPAAEDAFREFERLADQVVDRAINDA